MRPSGVRSKSAPHASSSFTRSGASFACSSAMRQLLRYCPPRIVSAKWTRQLSRSSTLPIAAAIPPSAMTVWALPSSDLQINPPVPPFPPASIAARSPAPPAPITNTSYDFCSIGVSNKPDVVPYAHGTETHEDVAEGDREEADEGP